MLLKIGRLADGKGSFFLFKQKFYVVKVGRADSKTKNRTSNKHLLLSVKPATQKLPYQR